MHEDVKSKMNQTCDHATAVHAHLELLLGAVDVLDSP